MSQTLASGLLKIEADVFQKCLPSEQILKYLSDPRGSGVQRGRWGEGGRRGGEDRDCFAQNVPKEKEGLLLLLCSVVG